MTLSFEMSLVFYFSFFTIEVILAYIIQKVTRVQSNTRLVKWSNFQFRFNTKAFIVFVIMILCYVLIVGNRYGIGTDYFNYRNIFYGLVYNYSDNFEIIVTILMKLCNYFENGYQLFLSICGLIISAFAFKSLKDHCDDINYPLMMFIYFMTLFPPSLNIIRQSMAVSIVMVGYKYVVKRNFFMYFIIILIASLFHKTAIFCLPVYFVYFKKDKLKLKENIIIILCAVIPFFLDYLYAFVTSLDLFEKYKSYDLQDNTRYIVANVVPKIPIILLILIFKNQLEKNKPENKLYVILYIVEILCFVIGGMVEWAFRFSYYFMISEIILVPQIADFFSKRSRILFYIGVVIYYIVIFWLQFVYRENDGIFPYSFISYK